MKRILIIKTGALGDVIISTGPIRRIIENHKEDKIWLLTSPAYSDIFKDWSNLHIIAFHRRGVQETIRTICWIRKKRFHRLYDLQSNDRTGLLCFLSSVPERVGNHPRPPYTIHPLHSYNRITPIFYRLHEILDCAGLKDGQYLPELPLSREDERHVEEFIQKHNLLNGRFVLIHAGASEKHPQKCWPHFLSLALILEKQGYRILWVGSDNERSINSEYAKSTGIDISGIFNICQLAELGKRGVFALTNDSGPMHALATAGIPVYAFFGPTNWRRHHAVGQEKYVISTDIYKNDPFKPAPVATISLEKVVNRLQDDGWLQND